MTTTASPTSSSDLGEFLPPPANRPAWVKPLLIAGAVVCFILGIVFWLLPVITGIPFHIAAAFLLAGASESCRKLLNRWEARLPHKHRLRLRRWAAKFRRSPKKAG